MSSSTGAAQPAAIPSGFVKIPHAALRTCRRIEMLTDGCPTLVPKARYRNPGGSVRLFTYFSDPPKHGFPSLFNFQWRAEDPNDPYLNHPPNLVHIVLYGAKRSVTRFPHAFLSGWPTTLGRIADGDVSSLGRSGLALGYVAWHGRRGSLALIPPYGYGGMQGDHLVFRWCSHGTDLALGLHAWEPFTETVDSLRTIIGSLPQSHGAGGGCSGPRGT